MLTLCDMKRYQHGAGRAKRGMIGQEREKRVPRIHISDPPTSLLRGSLFIKKTRRELSSYLSCLSAAQQEVFEKTTRLSVRNGWI